MCFFFLPTTPFCFPVVEMCIFVYCQPLTIHKSETERGPESSCHGPIYTGLPAARYARETRFFFFFFFFFSRTNVFVSRQHPVCPFETADWLNRLQAFIIYTVFLTKKNKISKILVATAASSVALHGLPKADAGRRSNNLLQTFHRRLLQIW